MKNRIDKKGKAFRKLGVITVLSVYLLIFVGGVVRSTGSGMGCPDWPKCFGQWIPPTDVSELPADYQQIYSDKRARKNERLVAYLELMGLSNQAERIRNDEAILEEGTFNVTKTWIEYVNRLIGALIGLFIFATMISSTKYWRTDRSIVVLSFLTFLLVGIQGWIGSLVVSTNLLTWMVTVHMLIALLILALLLYVVFRSFAGGSNGEITKRKRIISVAIICLIVSVVQIVLGTQVREAIDVIASSLEYQMRGEWIEKIGLKFYIHRSYSILILVLNGYLIYLLMKNKANKWLNKLGRGVIALIVFEIFTGVIMAYFAIPAFVQPVHLLTATLIFGVQFLLILSVNNNMALAKVKE